MEFWVYENTIHKKARIHRADCSFCSSGRGIHGGGDTTSGRWFGPFVDQDAAISRARDTHQADVRACTVCMEGERVAQFPTPSPPAPRAGGLDDSGPWEWDKEEQLVCTLRLCWRPLGRVIIDGDGKARFPVVTAVAGLYRFKTHYPDGRIETYIGESDNLRRRFSNYRNPGPTQQTSLRINAWLRELLGSGGAISVAILDDAHTRIADAEVQADLSQKSVRRLFEQFAISAQDASEIDILNR